MKLASTIVAIFAASAAFADNVPQGGVKDSPATVALTPIGNGTPAQGVARLTGPDGSQTFHAINQTTTYRRAQGGTAVVNGGDGFTNAHEAELRNRAALIASLPPVEHPDYSDVFAAYDAELTALRGQGADAMRAASGAAALAQIDLPQTGGIGVSVASVDGHGSFAAKAGYAVTGDVTVSVGIFAADGITGGAAAVVWGF
jgi:hypothetical protein